MPSRAVVRPTRMHGPGAAYYPLAPEPSRAIFVAGLACFALVGGALGGIVPRFAEVYESVDVPMPDSTRLLCSVSAVFPYVSPLYVVLAGIASWRLRRFRHADVVLFLGTGLVAAFIVIALFLPLIGLHHGIGSR